MQARHVGLVVGAALAVALPAALLAQVADVLSDGDDVPVVAYPLVLVVLGGMAVGGVVLIRRVGSAATLLEAALGGLVAISLVQALGVVRRLAADEDVAWSSVPVAVVLGVALAVVGARLEARRPGRTRP